MEKIEILFGFSDNVFEDAVKEKMASLGYDAHIVSRFSKASVLEYLEKNKDCNTVILKEICSKSMVYTAEEVARLTDARDVNVIIVLNSRHQGTDYMKTLYGAGITGALFQKGRSGGVTVKEIVAMILNRRSRKDAREYYGIANQKIEVGNLDIDAYIEYYREMKSGEGSLLENYLLVCSKMSPQQIADFTHRLPKNEQDELVQFEEFHTVMMFLKKFGYDMKYKKPRRARVGLVTPYAITADEERIAIHKVEQETSEENSTEENCNGKEPEKAAADDTAKPETEPSPDKACEEVGDDTDNKGMSFTDMLMGTVNKEPEQEQNIIPEQDTKDEASLADLFSAFTSGSGTSDTTDEGMEHGIASEREEEDKNIPDDMAKSQPAQQQEAATQQAEVSWQESAKEEEQPAEQPSEPQKKKTDKKEEKAKRAAEKQALKEEKRRKKEALEEEKRREKIRKAEEAAEREDEKRHEQKYGGEIPSVPVYDNDDEYEEYDDVSLGYGENSRFPFGIVALMVLGIVAIAAYLYVSGMY